MIIYSVSCSKLKLFHDLSHNQINPFNIYIIALKLCYCHQRIGTIVDSIAHRL